MEKNNNEKARPTHLRRNFMTELKETIPSHANGTFLENINEEELKTRAFEKKKRKEELKAVEEVLKKKCQVKFLVDTTELDAIKTYAQVSHQTQSEFIRAAIRDKIRMVEIQSKNGLLQKNTNIQENEFRLDELTKIRKMLEKLERNNAS